MVAGAPALAIHVETHNLKAAPAMATAKREDVTGSDQEWRIVISGTGNATSQVLDRIKLDVTG